MLVELVLQAPGGLGLAQRPDDAAGHHGGRHHLRGKQARRHRHHGRHEAAPIHAGGLRHLHRRAGVGGSMC